MLAPLQEEPALQERRLQDRCTQQEMVLVFSTDRYDQAMRMPFQEPALQDRLG